MNIGYEKNFFELMMNNEIDGYYIYFLLLDGNVIYVGQTKNVFGRIAGYKCGFIKGISHNPRLQEMFDNGEMKRVIFMVKDQASSLADAIRLEKMYIQEYRDTCLNKYDMFFSKNTRKKLSVASKKMWKVPTIRENIIAGISKRRVLTSPDGTVYKFSNSYAVKEFLEELNSGMHPNDRKRIGYQMLESFGENKGWKMSIEGKRPPSRWMHGILITPGGEKIPICGKSELVNINRNRKFRLNINRFMKRGSLNGFTFTDENSKKTYPTIGHKTQN
jgi:hypothetical protein